MITLESLSILLCFNIDSLLFCGKMPFWLTITQNPVLICLIAFTHTLDSTFEISIRSIEGM